MLDAAAKICRYDLKIVAGDGETWYQLWILTANAEWHGNGKLFEPDVHVIATRSTLICDFWSPISVSQEHRNAVTGHRRCSRSAWLACCRTIGLQPTVSTLCQRGSRTYPPQQLRSSHQRCPPFPLLLVHGKLQYRLLFSFLHSCWEDLDENEDHLLSIERWLIWLSLHWSVECASIQVCRRKYWIARNEYIQGACFFPRLLYVLQLTSLNEFLLIVHQGEGVWLLLFMLIVLWELLTG